MIVFLCCLIFLSALLSAGETAFFSLSPWTLRSYQVAKEPRLSLIAHLMERPRDLLVTILILNVMANLLVQNVVSNLFGSFNSWALQVGVPLGLTLIFGEVLPKSIALPSNQKVAFAVAPFLSGATRVTKPIRDPMTRITSWISRFLFFFLHKEQESSPEELRHVLKTSEERGVLLEQECDLINGTIDLRQSLVKERMRPREAILFYDLQEPFSKLIHLFVDLQTSRIPVCNGNLETLLGILSVGTFLLHQREIEKGKDIRPFLKKAYFVPETTKGWTLLKHLREKKEDLAIVVDEYGTISGLITQEDLIEAVIGEIKDRRDQEALYIRSSEDVIIASGKLELSEFKEIFKIPLLSKQGAITLGGWLIEELADIPIMGMKYATDQFFFYILEALPNRIEKIYVRRLKKGNQ